MDLGMECEKGVFMDSWTIDVMTITVANLELQASTIHSTQL